MKGCAEPQHPSSVNGRRGKPEESHDIRWLQRWKSVRKRRKIFTRRRLTQLSTDKLGTLPRPFGARPHPPRPPRQRPTSRRSKGGQVMRRLSIGALLAHHIEVSMRKYLRGITPARGHLRSMVTMTGYAFLCMILLAHFAAADPCVDYRQYIHKTGTLPTVSGQGIAAAPGRAYVAGGRGLPVVYLPNPDAPAILGQVTSPGVPRDVALARDLALVPDGGLRIVDVSNPSSPMIVGSVDGMNAGELATMGNIAFVGGSSGVTVIDVTVPSTPQVLGTIPSSYEGTPVPYAMQDVAVVGSILYALSVDLQIFDVTDPGSPVLLATCPPSSFGGGSRLAIIGNMAYMRAVATNVVDVSNPAAPILASTLQLGSWEDLVVDGNHAFVMSAYPGLKVYAVTAPAAPLAIGFVGNMSPYGPQGIAVSGDRLFWVAGNGMTVVDIQPPISPPAARVDTPGNAQGVALAGTYAYVADGSSLQVVSVADRLAPVIVGSVPVEANVV